MENEREEREILVSRDFYQQLMHYLEPQERWMETSNTPEKSSSLVLWTLPNTKLLFRWKIEQVKED